MNLTKKILLLQTALFVSTGLFAIPIFPPLIDYDGELSFENENVEIRALCPFFEYSSSLDGRFLSAAFHPAWSYEKHPESWEKEPAYGAMDVMWPLFVMRETAYESYFCFCFVFYCGASKKEEGNHGGHMGLMPLWLCGFDKKTDEFYWAFFPLYGEARNFLAYDSMFFILFPLYLNTKKEDQRGESYLWPIVNQDESSRFKKFRIFPFYAYHDIYGECCRTTYLWPFFHTVEYKNQKASGEGWLFLPVLGHNIFNDLHSWSFLWPFFSVHNRLDGEGKRSGFGIDAPWPLFQYRKNTDRNDIEKWRLYIWPLWGSSERKDSSYSFVLWPFASTESTRAEQGVVDWIWLLPFYWSKNAQDKDGKDRENYRMFWPFASYFSDGKTTKVKALDIIPFRNYPVIERNLNPLWMIYNYEKCEKGFRHDVLWGIFKYAENSEHGDRFTIFPFYSSHCNIPPKEDDADGVSPETVRDYMFGIFRTISRRNGERSCRLFWFIPL